MKRLIEQLDSSLAIGAVLALVIALPVAAADVEMKLEATPGGSVVRLGDVARVVAASQEEADRLASLPIVPAPAPGTNRFLRMREVQDLLAAHGEDLSQLNFKGQLLVQVRPAAGVAPAATKVAHVSRPSVDRRAIWSGQVTAAESLTTSRVDASARVETAEPMPSAAEVESLRANLDKLITDYLGRSSGQSAQWQVGYDLGAGDRTKLLAAKSALVCNGGSQPWTGRQRLAISFIGEHGPERVSLYVNATATQSVVLAVQPLESGHIITAADVELQPMENVSSGRSRREPAMSIESLIGKEVLQAVQAGDVIWNNDFRSPLLVERGEEIAVYARGGGIQVRTLAKACTDGSRGELITVESQSSKEKFDAVVTGLREAVVFSGTPAPEKEKVTQRPFRKVGKK